MKLNKIEINKILYALYVCTDNDIEILTLEEIKTIVDNEIYFMGYDFEEALNDNIEKIRGNGKSEINSYLQEIESNHLNEHQEILLIEVLLRIIESDNEVQENELKFLQMVKSKLKADEQTLIVKFPKHIDYLLDFNNYGLNKEFTEEINFN